METKTLNIHVRSVLSKNPTTILTRTVLLFIIAIVALSIFTPLTRGAAIQGVTINSFSSEYVAPPDLRRASTLVSDSGFFGDFHTTGPRGSMWLSSPTDAGAYSNAFVTFDLGSVQVIHQMKVWNYNEGGVNTQRGIQRANISVAGEDLVFTTTLPNTTFTRALGTFTNNFAQLINMGGVAARYVRINVITNFGNDNRVGLSKVRFINTNVPPTVDLVTRSFSGNRVTVKFSESVSPASATNIANYSIQSGATTASIISAAIDSVSDRVVLETSTLNSNLVYTLTAQNVFEASGVTKITNSTVTIAPELVLWLKADAGVTADPGGVVSQWNDQSGVGNNATETDPVAQPTWIDGQMNGKPVVRFNGTSSGMVIPHSSSLIAKGDISFFAVVRSQGFNVYNSILSKSAGPALNFPATFDYELAVTTGKPRLLRGNGSSISTLNGNSNAVVGQSYIVELVVKGTNAVHYLNGTFNGNAFFTEGVDDQGTPVRVGRREDGTIWMNGDIAEIILVRGAVSETERLDLDAYLGRKYGIITPNIGPPVITKQPVNVTNYVGETATFSVTLTNGVMPRANQWYKTPNVLLVGQTNTSLVLSNVALVDNNTSYYLISTNQDGSIQSDTATLTVLPLTPPYFTQQPQPVSAYIHQSATFTVGALGPQLSYQWKFGNTVIAGATNSTLTVSNLSTNQAGLYSVTVTNPYGTTNSQAATLTVLVPPVGSYAAAVLDANPALYYRFSDINETNVTFNFGSLGTSHNGVYEGSYTPDFGPLPPEFAIFEENNPAYKDETLTAGGAKFPAFNLNASGTTFAAWIYKDFLQSSFASAFFSRATGQSCGLGVKTVTGQDMLEYHWNDGFSTYNSGLIVPNSQWTFIAVVVEPTKATLYMNAGSGMQSATNVAAHTARPVLNPGYVGWDNFNANRRWYGKIDEAMIFTRPLTPIQISALYSGTVIPQPVPLTITHSGSNVILSWPNGTLQQADEATGAYSDMTGVTSPYSLSPSGTKKFYRVRVQ